MTSLVRTPSLAAFILSRNEEQNLPDCLRSLEGIAAELYVIDSGSTDGTVRIAREFGAQVRCHEFVSHAKQFNWALTNIGTRADWILRIDADERVSAQLHATLIEILPAVEFDVAGLEVPIRIRFLGRDLRWGDSYPVWLVRLFRNGRGKCDDAWMDERVMLSEGRTQRVRGDLIHEIPRSLAEWTLKHNWYSDRECRDLASRKDGALNSGGGRRKLLKQELYLRLPPLSRALCYWFYRYFLCLGFLDGKEGLIYHFLHAFWYRFLVDAKLYEMSVKRRSESTAKPRYPGRDQEADATQE